MSWMFNMLSSHVGSYFVIYIADSFSFAPQSPLSHLFPPFQKLLVLLCNMFKYVLPVLEYPSQLILQVKDREFGFAYSHSITNFIRPITQADVLSLYLQSGSYPAKFLMEDRKIELELERRR